MKNILLTGGAGFIGINFLIYWSNKYKKDQIIVLDKLTYSANLKKIKKLTKSNSKIIFIKGDICNDQIIKKILNKYKINYIINFAAETHVDNSIKNPNSFIYTNIFGTFNLIENAKSYWDKTKILKNHFHQISTDEVYGSLLEHQRPFLESAPFNPSSPYSSSKASADLLLKSYFKTYKSNITISNTSNNFGPYINIEKLIPKTIVNILNNLKIPIYGNGKQVREWIHVNDHILGIEKILSKGKFGESYNLGSNHRIKNIDLVNKICKIVDNFFRVDRNLKKIYPKAKKSIAGKSTDLIKFVEDRKGHDYRYSLNINKAKKVLFYKYSKDFDNKLKSTIEWFIYNKNEWND